MKLDTMNASLDQPGPWVTLTALLAFSWSRVVRPSAYVPLIAPVSRPEVSVVVSGTPLSVICCTCGWTEVFQ